MGKSSSAPPPVPAPPPQNDMMPMFAMMMEMMASMSAGGGAATPHVPAAPDIERVPEIDWEERQAELEEKMRADYLEDAKRKKGTTDTILTSPLLDEEEADTTESILTSGE